MVYSSVPDHTSASWAEKAGVDVCVVGDSLAMVAHGHKSTIPASMEMMVMHALLLEGCSKYICFRMHALSEL